MPIAKIKGIDVGGGYTYTVANLTALNALTGETSGETAWMTAAPDGFGKAWYFNGTTWQVQGETVEITNKSGGALAEGKVVTIDGGNNNACDTVAVGFVEDVIGPVVIGGADSAQITVAYNGIWNVDCNEAVTRGEWLRTSATAGEAAGDANPAAGMFGQVLQTTGGAGLARSIIFSKEMF